MTRSPRSILVVSLDFELYWGLRDQRTLSSYKQNLLGVRRAIPLLLDLFLEYEIHATWATVGFLFYETREQLIQGLPQIKPEYLDQNLSPYANLEGVGINEEEDPFHFAPSVVSLILSYPNQEIGSHTFSHYYCLEKGQDIASFREDLQAFKRVATRYGLNIASLVFPRNQVKEEYLAECKQLGITAYRGNVNSPLDDCDRSNTTQRLKRGFRLLDTYLNLSGHNGFKLVGTSADLPLNIPSSRFLRPYSPSLTILEPLRLRRILMDLTHASKNGLAYHLWWHPHNFGTHTEKNISFLRKILDHYKRLRDRDGMESLNMQDVSRLVGAGSQ